MSISEETVEELGKLAKIDLTEDEKRQYREELGAIIEYVEKLEELNLEEVEPTTHSISISAPLRDDEPETRLTTEEALSNGPDVKNNQFRVPSVIED